jgi:kynurenine 3-monooxygenase
MSSKTADDKFLNRKGLSDRHPDKWIPLYSRVTFRIDHSEALAIGFSNEIMQNVILIDNIEEKWIVKR